MKMIKFISGIVLIALTAACKHPIEIEGQGDVLSATGSRNCYLEDFQAGSSKCTRNKITGEYNETYTAVPRDGWKFDRWENYCTDTATNNRCPFNVNADTVVQYKDDTMPPLRAVFIPANSSSGSAGDLGFDGFESGNWNYDSGKFDWGGATLDEQGSKAYVQNGKGKNGSKALMLEYRPENPVQDGALSQLWFNLDKYYPELTIEFDYYVPANFKAEYLFSASVGIGKLLRIYGDSYNDALKVGISAFINPEFKSGMDDVMYIGPTYMVGVGSGHGAQGNMWDDPRAYMFNQKSETGRWFHIKLYIKAPTKSSNSIQRLTVDGKHTVEYSNDTYHPDNPPGYKQGYIGGNSSNGYRQTTIMRIDNVRFRAGKH